MGEQKRKRLAATKLAEQLTATVERISTVIQKLATAASSHLGADCYLHAELGAELLRGSGFEAQLVVGYAAWRVGPGDGDVISHGPHTQGFLPAGAQQGLPYHAWLELHGVVIDLTTYQLQRKARELDAADGGQTSVMWCPDFLVLPRFDIRQHRQVANALRPGVAYYEARPELNTILKPASSLDPAHVFAARLLLANPDAQVFGPNNRQE